MNEELLVGLTDEQKEAFGLAEKKLNKVGIKSKSKRTELVLVAIENNDMSWVPFLTLLLDLMKLDPENKLKWKHETLRFYLAKMVKSGIVSSRKSESLKSKEYSITYKGNDVINSIDESNQES